MYEVEFYLYTIVLKTRIYTFSFIVTVLKKIPVIV